MFDVDSLGRPVMRYIDQFVQPKDFRRRHLAEPPLRRAGDQQKTSLSIPVPVGKFLLINNLFLAARPRPLYAAPGPAPQADAPARLLRIPRIITRLINKGFQAKELSGCMIS
ncbi:carbon starvation induced protein CsiD [Klebsiella pneumoniae subsp. pneumoniae]|nr:carbon starvation induced protein CsiD [Klebsiella pneumoniae subsp. pneumoniae]